MDWEELMVWARSSALENPLTTAIVFYLKRIQIKKIEMNKYEILF